MQHKIVAQFLKTQNIFQIFKPIIKQIKRKIYKQVWFSVFKRKKYLYLKQTNWKAKEGCWHKLKTKKGNGIKMKNL